MVFGKTFLSCFNQSANARNVSETVLNFPTRYIMLDLFGHLAITNGWFIPNTRLTAKLNMHDYKFSVRVRVYALCLDHLPSFNTMCLINYQSFQPLTVCILLLPVLSSTFCCKGSPQDWKKLAGTFLQQPCCLVHCNHLIRTHWRQIWLSMWLPIITMTHINQLKS